MTNNMLGGYTVEVVEGNKHVAYKLHGSRGACYRLLRTVDNPSLMFAMNKNGRIVSVAGDSYFSDKTGELRAVSAEQQRMDGGQQC